MNYDVLITRSTDFFQRKNRWEEEAALWKYCQSYQIILIRIFKGLNGMKCNPILIGLVECVAQIQNGGECLESMVRPHMSNKKMLFLHFDVKELE